MSRPTKKSPERGDARARLLEAARDLIRRKGFHGTSIDELCHAAEVTKGAFFHQFGSKAALGVAAAAFWAETTSAFFASAPYHAPADPFDRVLAYVFFRRSIIAGDIADFSCLVGTMVQEVHAEWPEIREACASAIFGHAATLEADFAAAMNARGLTGVTSPQSLAAFTQAVLQGAFVLAKAQNTPDAAIDSLDHLDRYLRLLFRPVIEAPND